ncbi:MAG TPA: rRNA maturation RNase YbeY [Herbaspirillum sp.]|jgi:probable rRNA maturation factor
MPPKNKLSLSVQYPDARLKPLLSRGTIRRWVQSALFAPAELTIRFVDADEGRALNRDYRGKDYATNVLTFAYSEDNSAEDEGNEVTQADIVLCTDVLQREAKEQGKTLEQHAAHLIVHGVLHAQGYDHETDEEAAEMEQIEIELLAALKMPNPYALDGGPRSV